MLCAALQELLQCVIFGTCTVQSGKCSAAALNQAEIPSVIFGCGSFTSIKKKST